MSSRFWLHRHATRVKRRSQIASSLFGTELHLSAIASGHFLRGEMTSRKGFRFQRSVWSDRYTLMRQSAAIRFPRLRRALRICTLRSLNTLNGCLFQCASRVQHCTGYGFAFVNFLNTDQSNSEMFFFSVCQDVHTRMSALSWATERASPVARGQD